MPATGLKGCGERLDFMRLQHGGFRLTSQQQQSLVRLLVLSSSTAKRFRAGWRLLGLNPAKFQPPLYCRDEAAAEFVAIHSMSIGWLIGRLTGATPKK